MKIVLLLGPSSVGKSTLCGQLEKEHHWKMISEDEVFVTGKAARATAKLEAFKTQGVTEALSTYMTEEQINRFCTQGKLSMSLGEHRKGDNRIIDMQLSPKSPPIEAILKKENFNVDEIITISNALRTANKIHQKFDLEIVYEVFDEAFQLPKDSPKEIILDVVPDSKETAIRVIEQFNKRADEFKSKYPEEPLEIYTILAYCPPQELSDRIHNRNLAAERDNQPENKRIGLFPFEQFSALTTVLKPHSNPKEEISEPPAQEILGNISRPELLKIAYRHQYPEKNENRTKRVARAALNSVKLAKRYALWNDESPLPLVPHHEIRIDATLNTTAGQPSPATLANSLLKILDDVNVRRKEEASIVKKL